MRMLCNGVENNTIEMVYGGAGPALRLQFLEDDGTMVDLDADTASLEFYTRADRSDTPISMSITLGGTTDSNGYGTLTPTMVQTATLTKGIMYAFGKTTESAVVRFATKPVRVAVL